MAWSKCYKNCTITGPLDAFCLVCERHIKTEEELDAHFEKSIHKKNLESTPYFLKFKDDRIRKVKKGYYCEFCNVLFVTAAKVGLHIVETQHQYNRSSQMLRRVNNMVYAFDSVVIGDNEWNGFVDDTCAVCNVEFESDESHKNEENHTLNLILKKIEFIDDKLIYRKIDESSYHCMTCNLVLAIATLTTHAQQEDHLEKLEISRAYGRRNTATTVVKTTKERETQSRPTRINSTIHNTEQNENQVHNTEQNETQAHNTERNENQVHNTKQNENQVPNTDQKENRVPNSDAKMDAKAGSKKTEGPSVNLSKDDIKNPADLEKYICSVLKAKNYVVPQSGGKSMCILCDWNMDTSAIPSHVSSRHHLTILKMHKKRLDTIFKEKTEPKPKVDEEDQDPEPKNDKGNQNPKPKIDKENKPKPNVAKENQDPKRKLAKGNQNPKPEVDAEIQNLKPIVDKGNQGPKPEVSSANLDPKPKVDSGDKAPTKVNKEVPKPIENNYNGNREPVDDKPGNEKSEPQQDDNIYLEVDNATCKSNVQKHKKPGQLQDTKTHPLDNAVDKAEPAKKTTKPVAMKQNEEGRSSRASSISSTRDEEQLETFAKQNDLTFTDGKMYCPMCDSQLPTSIKNLKEHVLGAQHKKNKQTKKNIANNAASRLATTALVKIPTIQFVQTMIKVRNTLVLEIIVNGKFAISRMSLMMITSEDSVTKCQLCDLVLRAEDVERHKASQDHISAVSATMVITSIDNEFIREPQPDLYHCGICANVERGWANLQTHLAGRDHREKSIAAAWRLMEYMTEIRRHHFRPMSYRSIMNMIADLDAASGGRWS